MTARIARSFSSPTVTFRLEADVVETRSTGGAGYGRWRIRYRLTMTKPSGSAFNGSGVQAGRGNGVEFGRVERNPFLPSGVTSWNESWDDWVNANSNGYWSGSSQTYPLQMHLVYGNIADVSSGSVALPRIAQLPGKPPRPTLKSRTTTSISFGISAPSSNGGSAIQTYDLQALTEDGSVARSWSSGASSQVASPLNPGTDYRIRYRAVNGRGDGPWSDELDASTLPSVPPGMTVTPNIAGTAAAVALTPPQGVSSVTSYRVERRPVGGSATVYNKTSSPITITGLAPGSIHEYRASAFIGSYQTPWTGWVTRTQPQPNTNPGDYFDGSTVDKPDTDYQWNGTVNNSTSRAVAKTPTGWRSFSDGSATSGGDGVVIRATGGRSGEFGARVTFFADTESAGFRAGTALETPGVQEVAEGGVYWGSIHVSPERAQLMAAEMIWLDAAFVPVGDSTVGNAVLVEADPESTTRLIVQGTAPLGAVYGAVGWVDVDGDGWSPWLGGESVMMDDAMLSIGTLYGWFSGDTADSASWGYSWLGAPNASVSMATALDPEDVDLLADPDCPPIPSPPQPPQIADNCIEEVGSWRRYWAIISEDQVSDWLAIVPTITVETSESAARQVRIRFYRNADSLAPEEAGNLVFESEQIISYIPPFARLTLDGVSRRVWATVGESDELPASHLLYGTGGGPATWPTLDCGSSYLISFDVPLDAPNGNLTVGVSLTTRMM